MTRRSSALHQAPDLRLRTEPVRRLRHIYRASDGTDVVALRGVDRMAGEGVAAIGPWSSKSTS